MLIEPNSLTSADAQTMVAGQDAIQQRGLAGPDEAGKDSDGHSTPTLPSPLRGGGLGWGAKDTGGEVL
jgi:hypothetical protein